MPPTNTGGHPEPTAFAVGPIDGAPDIAPGTECRALGPSWPEAEAALEGALARAHPNPMFERVDEETFALWAKRGVAAPRPSGTIKATFKVSRASGYLMLSEDDSARELCIEVVRSGENWTLVPRLAAAVVN